MKLRILVVSVVEPLPFQVTLCPFPSLLCPLFTFVAPFLCQHLSIQLYAGYAGVLAKKMSEVTVSLPKCLSSKSLSNDTFHFNPHLFFSSIYFLSISTSISPKTLPGLEVETEKMRIKSAKQKRKVCDPFLPMSSNGCL